MDEQAESELERAVGPERNKAIARAEFEIWSSGEVDGLEGLVASDVVHHDPYDPHAAGGLEGLRKSIAANRAAFQDFQIAIEDQVAAGDRVATRWTATMTPRDESSSAGDGKPVTLAGITIERFENGKVVESWRSMDRLGLLRKLGVLPPA